LLIPERISVSNSNRKEKEMRKMSVCLAVVCCVVFLGGIAVAQQKAPVEKVLEGCMKEVETYCKDVTPGKGRLLSCLYAYEDKISAQCEMALCDAVPALERALTTLSYLAGECRDDLKKYCSDVKTGQGRLINCLDEKKNMLTDRCKAAFDEIVVK
jgi:hypothetical protein